MLIPFEKLIRKYNIHPKGVLHVGASTGQEAKDYFNNGIEHVIWIEAIPDVFNRLCRNIAEFPNMVSYNECISNVDGANVTFNVSNNEAQSSSILPLGTHKKAHPEVHYTHSIQCTTKRIGTLITGNKIDLSQYDFLNIDLQGAELMALEGMGTEIDKIKYAYLEVNKEYLYEGCALIQDIDAFMHVNGFKRVELEWCGNFGWGDAFYIR